MEGQGAGAEKQGSWLKSLAFALAFMGAAWTFGLCFGYGLLKSGWTPIQINVTAPASSPEEKERIFY